MKILCVHPGASYATGDVFHGFARALVAQGHDVKSYDLCTRLDEAVTFYRWRNRRRGAVLTWEEALTKAAMDVVPQALYHLPDWVLVFSGMYFHPDFFVLLKRAGMRVALVASESPYDDEQHARIAPHVDLVFTNERTSVATLRRHNPNTHYLAHAYDPERSNADAPLPDDIPRHDVLFIGTLFEERIDLLGAVDWDGLDFAIYGSTKLLPSRHRLRRYVKGDVVDNARAQQMYRAARINLNPYRTSVGYGIGVAHIERAESLNPRALELAACGAFQLSDYRRELSLVLGTQQIWYDGPDGLGEQVRYFLTNPTVRRAKVVTAMCNVQTHTYAARAAQLTATLAGHGVAPRDALAAD